MKRIYIALLLLAGSLGVASAQKTRQHLPKKNTNLIVNGDFSQGNTGFITNYVFVDHSDFVHGGIYMIGTTSTIMHHQYSNIVDHNPDSNPRNMMVIANSRAGAQDVMWQQDVTVK